MTKKLARRRPRPKPVGERLLDKGLAAFESALDLVAEDPEKALDRAGEFLNRFTDGAAKAHRAYRRDPEGVKREVRNMAVGALAEFGRKRRRLKR